MSAPSGGAPNSHLSIVNCVWAWRDVPMICFQQCAVSVVWCGVVWCGVPKALLPNGNGWDALHTDNAKWEGCVSKPALCVVCCAPVEGRHPLWRWAAAVQGCPRDALSLCLMVLPKF